MTKSSLTPDLGPKAALRLARIAITGPRKSAWKDKLMRRNEDHIKIISIFQPWATLIALGIKRYETRSWAPVYRGPLVIHAGKKLISNFDNPAVTRAINKALGKGWEDQLPRGHIVALCNLKTVHQANRLRLSSPTSLFGNFSRGMMAWELENVTELDHVPLKGQQGLFNIPVSILK